MMRPDDLASLYRSLETRTLQGWRTTSSVSRLHGSGAIPLGSSSPAPRPSLVPATNSDPAGPLFSLTEGSYELTLFCRDTLDGQQPQYPQQAYYSGPPGGGDKGPQMYQNGAPGMQQGYYPPPQQGPYQGQYQGQQVRASIENFRNGGRRN